MGRAGFSSISGLSCFLVLLTSAVATSHAATVTVPGTSDPWLAGMPAGSTASETPYLPGDPFWQPADVAPAQSPVLVSLVLGSAMQFSATGKVKNNDDIAKAVAPDGNAGTMVTHYPGSQNGISGLTAPINSLLGIFLDDSQPNLTAAPTGLDFSLAGSTDFTTFAPALKQVFFIGDGKNSAGLTQTFDVPAGATRLFLGTMDGYAWSNNVGAFEVTATTVVPLPSAGLAATGLLATLGAVKLIRRRAA